MSGREGSAASAFERRCRKVTKIGLIAALGCFAFEGAAQYLDNLIVQKIKEPPKTLPRPVKKSEAAALFIERFASNGRVIAAGSAVKIGSDLVATAGHVMLADTKDKKTNACEYTKLFSSKSSSPTLPTEIAATESAKTDFALLKVKGDKSFKSLPSVPVAPKKAGDGTPVFFINYGMPSSNTFRFPTKNLASIYKWETGKSAYVGPARYAGEIIAQDSEMIQALTGLQSYGPDARAQKNSRPGASGGPVLIKNGELIGLTVQASFIRADKAENQYPIDLPMFGDAQVGISWVQPVNSEMVHQAEEALQPIHECK